MHHVGIIQNCGLPGIDLLLSFSVPGWGKGGWGAEIIAGWIWGLAGLLGGSKYLGCDNITSQIFFVNHGSQHSTFFGKTFLATPLELLALNQWFPGLIKITENKASTCWYYKFLLGSCWSKLTQLTELFPGRLSHKYFTGLHIISFMV